MRTKKTCKIWILTFFIISSLNTQAQNWSVFPTNSSRLYFENDNSLLFALEIDSTFNNLKTHQTFLSPTLEISASGYTFPCQGTPSGGVITGNQILQSDSVIEFRFYDGFLKIPLKAAAANSIIAQWPFTVSRISKRDSIINGVPDSIMEFKVTSIYNHFDSCLSKGSIIIGKQSGLLTSLGCFAFMPGANTYLDSPCAVYKSSPRMDAFKIWDFNIGDEFHFAEDDFHMMQGQTNLLNYIVLAKSVVGSDFVYTMSFTKQRTSKADTAGTETWIRPQQHSL